MTFTYSFRNCTMYRNCYITGDCIRTIQRQTVSGGTFCATGTTTLTTKGSNRRNVLGDPAGLVIDATNCVIDLWSIYS
jgi:hypothetical protein